MADFQSQGQALRTVEQYRYAIDRSVTPKLGALRIRELTVATCDRFLRAVEAKHGAPVVLGTRPDPLGACAATQHGAISMDRNLVRDTGGDQHQAQEPATVFDDRTGP